MVEFACRECAGCEWPSRSLDKDTLLQLICTLCCYLKRDIWKTADCCDKGGYDSSFSLPFLPSFASISPAHSVSLSSFSVSLSTFSFLFFPLFSFLFVFFFASSISPFVHPPSPSPLLVMTVPGTSVQSAKCHITEPEIPTWQSIWQRNDGEGEGASVLLSPKVSAGLWHPVYWWQQTRSRKDQNESILIMFCFLCFAAILHSNAPAASEDDFDTNWDYCGKGKVRKSQHAFCCCISFFFFFWVQLVKLNIFFRRAFDI